MAASNIFALGAVITMAVQDSICRGHRRVPVRMLACPACGGSLRLDADALSCETCSLAYGRDDGGSWNLRVPPPERPATIHAHGRDFDPSCVHRVLPPSDDGPIEDWQEFDTRDDIAATALTPAFVSHFPLPAQSGEWMLDLGCRDRVLERFCASATGFRYCGVDRAGAEPDLLAEPHALPFYDEAFAFVLSIAALDGADDLRPASGEAFRVLKPGGTFAGITTCPRPKPASGAHAGGAALWSALTEAGFEMVAIAPDRRRSVRAGGLRFTEAFRTLASAVPLSFVRIQQGRQSATRTLRVDWRGGFQFVARKARQDVVPAGLVDVHRLRLPTR